MSVYATHICLILIFTLTKSYWAEIVLPKCCLQHELMMIDGYCLDADLHFNKIIMTNFNYTLENTYKKFHCKYRNEVQIEFCLNKNEFSTNFNLSAHLVRKGDTVFQLDDHNYCVDNMINGHIIIKMCQTENICDIIPCVNRCCRPGPVWWNDRNNCRKPNVTNNSTLDPVNHRLDIDPVRGVRIKMTCESNIKKYTKTGYNFGSDLINRQLHNPNNVKYCTDTLQTLTTQFMYDHLCSPVGGTLELVKIIGIILSFLSILSAIIFYIVVPELLDLHGKLVLSLFVAMLFAYTTLMFGHNLLFTMKIGIKCKVLGYLIYFTAFSMFSWSNVLCYNIYQLSKTRNCDSSRSEEMFWYVRYLKLAFYYPVTMTICLIILDNVQNVPKYLKPKIGTKVCFFDDTTKNLSSYLIMFFIPSGIQITMNWIFFILLVKKIIITIRMLNTDRRFLKFNNASKLILMAKLCLVMGLPWTLELTLFFWQNEKLKIFADLFNSAGGLILFLVFVLTKSTFGKCRKRYDVKKRVKNAVKVMEGTPHTSLTSLTSRNGSNRSTLILIKD